MPTIWHISELPLEVAVVHLLGMRFLFSFFSLSVASVIQMWLPECDWLCVVFERKQLAWIAQPYFCMLYVHSNLFQRSECYCNVERFNHVLISHINKRKQVMTNGWQSRSTSCLVCPLRAFIICSRSNVDRDMEFRFWIKKMGSWLASSTNIYVYWENNSNYNTIHHVLEIHPGQITSASQSHSPTVPLEILVNSFLSFFFCRLHIVTVFFILIVFSFWMCFLKLLGVHLI